MEKFYRSLNRKSNGSFGQDAYSRGSTSRPTNHTKFAGTRSTRPMSLCSIELIRPSSQLHGDSIPSRFDNRAKIGCRDSPANTIEWLKESGLVAGHWCASLIRAVAIIWVIVIRQLSRSLQKQFARVMGQDCSTLARNLDKRSVIVNATPLGRVSGTGTGGHLKDQ